MLVAAGYCQLAAAVDAEILLAENRRVNVGLPYGFGVAAAVGNSILAAVCESDKHLVSALYNKRRTA